MKKLIVVKCIVLVATLLLLSFPAWAISYTNPESLKDLGNAGDATIQQWLIGIFGNNAAFGSTPALKVDSPGNISNIPVLANDYVVLHWGGSGGGVFEAFQITSNGSFTVPTSLTGGGLSSYAIYGPTPPSSSPVPEPGTMILVGSGLIGLWTFRKKFKK
jgi:hypothetical protein